ncbi:hypothetical protein HY639_03845 [Candidatus Woesearchaeota archaeon]|nr:hypothetical protein [Candidatus Woesearchaeota archaeon]
MLTRLLLLLLLLVPFVQAATCPTPDVMKVTLLERGLIDADTAQRWPIERLKELWNSRENQFIEREKARLERVAEQEASGNAALKQELLSGLYRTSVKGVTAKRNADVLAGVKTMTLADLKKGYLASGSFGDVYRTRVAGQDVVVKVVRPDMPSELYAMQKEAYMKLEDFLHSPGNLAYAKHIARYRGETTVSGVKVVVFDYAAMKPLTKTDVPQMAEAMDFLRKAHARGIIHGDIAKDNVQVRPDGAVVFIDWGGRRATAQDDLDAFMRLRNRLLGRTPAP